MVDVILAYMPMAYKVRVHIVTAYVAMAPPPKKKNMARPNSLERMLILATQYTETLTTRPTLLKIYLATCVPW